MKLKRGIIALGLLSAVSLQSWAQQLKGVVIDKNSKETLIGAVISIEGTDVKAVTNVSGNFSFEGLKDGTYTLYIKYVGYKTLKIDGVQMKDANLTIALQPDEQQLKGVTVTAVERRNTDAAMIQVAKSSPVIVSNVSAQEISRTQDTNAGEVIRRVPGVSLIDDKFVMVRGLSQRYNNVWVNGGAVPSSEADSRAFSFDIIPSSQIDNLTIVKSPTAEYPADYSGGFIIVNTKEIPAENSFSLSVGGNWNTASAFQDFAYSKGSATDFLAFDNGMRSIHGGINASLAPQLDANGSPIDNYATSLLGNHLNNDWMVKSKKPLGDLKLAANLNHRWMLGGRTLGMLAALNYTNEYRTYEKMENNLFGIYDAVNDKPNYLRHSARTYMFSASNTPAATAAAKCALDIIKSEPQRIKALWDVTNYALSRFKEEGFEIGDTESPIIPLYIRDMEKTFAVTAIAFERGVFINPVVPPACAPSDTLVRYALMATHTKEQVDRSVEILKGIFTELGIIK